MMALVSSEELANDVTGAEALLERHQVTTPCNIYMFHMYMSPMFEPAVTNSVKSFTYVNNYVQRFVCPILH